jgi:hypothetical protein
VARVPDDTVVLAAPAAHEPISDVGTAVAEALRFPLSGPPLDRLVSPGARAVIVVEPPSLPLPAVKADPRRDAVAGVIDALEAAGSPRTRHTLLVAGGLERRAGRRELARLLRPDRARGFAGRVVVHDCEADDLRLLCEEDGERVLMSSCLFEVDAVLVVTAAETVSNGGPSALVRACDALSVRRLAEGDSLLEVGDAPVWRFAESVQDALARRVPVVGVSLALDHPRPRGRFREWPQPEGVAATLDSPLRALHGLLPSWLRLAALQELELDLNAVAILAGSPSVAHAEALLRGTALRGTQLPGELGTLVVPSVWTSPHAARGAPNAVTTAAVTLGHALRLWRGRPPLQTGGTVIVPHPLDGTIGRGSEAPYLRLYHAVRGGAEGRKLDAVERLVRMDARAVERYRASAAPHPLLPFADWASCRSVLDRAGRVIVAGCRDAGAARALGFVPTHNLAAALGMARGITEIEGPLGVLLAPPYPPLLVE